MAERRARGRASSATPEPSKQKAAMSLLDKGEQAFSIGELARELDVTTRTIRFYESMKLLSPERRGTARIYSPRDRARLRLILRGKNLGFSLEEISGYLSLYDADPKQVKQTQHLLQKVENAMDDLERKRADLDTALKELGDIRGRCRNHLAQTARSKSS